MSENDKNKEDFDLDWDTDTFESKGFAGVERDKRGELAVLLPAGERTISRLRGFVSRRIDAKKEAGQPEGKVEFTPEKGSLFSGELKDEHGAISIEDSGTTAEKDAGETIDTPPPDVDYGQTEVLLPGGIEGDKKPSMDDFDLDFSPNETKKKESRRQAAKASGSPSEALRKDDRSSIEQEEIKRPAPPRKEPSKAPKREHLEKPVLPDKSRAPLVVEHPARKSEEKAKDKHAQFPGIEAHSYLDDGSVLERDSAELKTPTTGKKTKKKMKLPKRMREGKTSPLLVLILIFLILVLAAILAVQNVPEAREYYDMALFKIFGKQKPGSGNSTEDLPQEESIKIDVGPTKIELEKGTDINSVKSYTDEMRQYYSEGRKAAGVRK